jgi:mercuric ion transport protein
MNDRKLLGTGLIGAVVAIVCCATPILPIMLAGIGLSVAVGYLDYVLLPAMAVFAAIAVYAVLKRRGAT